MFHADCTWLLLNISNVQNIPKQINRWTIMLFPCPLFSCRELQRISVIIAKSVNRGKVVSPI